MQNSYSRLNFFAVDAKKCVQVGVKPDLELPAASAMKVAYLSILTNLIKTRKDPDEKEGLKDILARVQSGAFQLPEYSSRH